MDGQHNMKQQQKHIMKVAPLTLTKREAKQSNTSKLLVNCQQLQNYQAAGFTMYWQTDLLCGPHVGGHVGVEIAEAVDHGKGEADNEPTQGTEHAPAEKKIIICF